MIVMEDAFAIKIVATSKLQQMRRALIVSAPAFLRKAAIPFIQYSEIITEKKNVFNVIDGGCISGKKFFSF